MRTEFLEPVMGKSDGQSPRVPKVTTVKLERDFFDSLWWVSRVEKKPAGEILEEIARAAVVARFKSYAATVAKLTQSDLEQDQLTAAARQRAAGSR